MVGRAWPRSGRGAATVEIVHEVATPLPEPPVRVTLAIGLLKGDQMDAVVRDATMLGASAIVPMRHGARRGAAAGVEERRGRSSAGGASRSPSAKQCGRAVVPAVSAVIDLRGVSRHRRGESDRDGVEPALAAGRLDAAADARPATAAVFVGPEGGWAPEEVARARSHGAQLRQLGPRTLRAEIVPTVVLSALWTAWGWQ